MKTLLAVLFFGPFLLSARAQAPVPQQSVDFHIAAHSRVRKMYYGVFDEAGALVDSVPLEFKTSGRSNKYSYRGPMPIVFFTVEPAPPGADPAAVVRTPVARMGVPADAGLCLFLFHPLPASETQGDLFQVHAVDLREESLPPGHVAVFNFTSETFHGTIGSMGDKGNPKIVNILPGINPPMGIQPKGQIRLAFQFENEQWVKVYDNAFDCDASERLLLVVYPPRFPGSPSLGGKLIRFPAESKEAGDGQAQSPPSP